MICRRKNWSISKSLNAQNQFDSCILSWSHVFSLFNLIDCWHTLSSDVITAAVPVFMLVLADFVSNLTGPLIAPPVQCSNNVTLQCIRLEWLIYIYIYAFSRRFYPKRLTLHSSYSFTFYQLLLSLGIEPMILALLAPCSTIWATGKPFTAYCVLYIHICFKKDFHERAKSRPHIKHVHSSWGMKGLRENLRRRANQFKGRLFVICAVTLGSWALKCLWRGSDLQYFYCNRTIHKYGKHDHIQEHLNKLECCEKVHFFL